MKLIMMKIYPIEIGKLWMNQLNMYIAGLNFSNKYLNLKEYIF